MFEILLQPHVSHYGHSQSTSNYNQCVRTDISYLTFRLNPIPLLYIISLYGAPHLLTSPYPKIFWTKKKNVSLNAEWKCGEEII